MNLTGMGTVAARASKELEKRRVFREYLKQLILDDYTLMPGIEKEKKLPLVYSTRSMVLRDELLEKVKSAPSDIVEMCGFGDSPRALNKNFLRHLDAVTSEIGAKRTIVHGETFYRGLHRK